MSPIFCSHTVSTIQPDQIMRRGSACREISQCNRSISWVRGSIEKYGGVVARLRVTIR